MVSCCCFFFQAEDGIRDLVRSRGLGDVYKRQECRVVVAEEAHPVAAVDSRLAQGAREATDAAREGLSLIHI